MDFEGVFNTQKQTRVPGHEDREPLELHECDQNGDDMNVEHRPCEGRNS